MPISSIRCLLASLLAACSFADAASLSFGDLPPDDAHALRELEQRVNAAARVTREWALERALDGVAIKKGSTEFKNVPSDKADEEDEEAGYRFPKKRPRGVRADEWKALRAFGGAVQGERGVARYRLFDIDGDGSRDLIVSTYNGGTSLVTETTALRRRGARFEAMGADFSFFEPERGGNNGAQWVRLNGRVYVALREGRHGEDKVSLVQPFAESTLRPTLTLRYRYRMGQPAPEETYDRRNPPQPLSPALRLILADGIARANGDPPPQRPLCPLAPGDDADSEPGSVAPHYFMEHAGAAAVWVDGRCHVGQLTDWYGRYTPDGLAARFCLLLPGGLDKDQSCYAVEGRRILVGISLGASMD